MIKNSNKLLVNKVKKCYISDIKFDLNSKGIFMDKELNQNFAALIAYSFTDRFQSIYKDTGDLKYLCERSQIFIQVFNTFKEKMVNTSDRDIKDLLQLLTRREFFISLVNKGISTTIEEISKVLKLKGDIKETVSMPVFKIGEEEYQAFFDQAQESYLESHIYHEKRHSMGADIAKHTFYHHWAVVGEVFNQLFAQDYVKSLQSKTLEEIPVIYKHTLSGHKYFSEEFTEITKKKQKVC